MRHLNNLTLFLAASLCFWAVRYPDDSLAALDWAKEQARIVVELVKEHA